MLAYVYMLKRSRSVFLIGAWSISAVPAKRPTKRRTTVRLALSRVRHHCCLTHSDVYRADEHLFIAGRFTVAGWGFVVLCLLFYSGRFFCRSTLSLVLFPFPPSSERATR